ncbi:hypothetical protein ACIU1J_09730 [Azospirillum doebereinerae]
MPTAPGSSSPNSSSVAVSSGAGSTFTVISVSAVSVPKEPAISLGRS